MTFSTPHMKVLLIDSTVYLQWNARRERSNFKQVHYLLFS